MMRPLPLLLLLISLAVMPAALAGCGGGDTETQAAGTIADKADDATAGTVGSESAAGTAEGECSIFNGTEAADAVGGTLVSSEEFLDTGFNQAKCTFFIDINGNEKVFVMWQMPAEDFNGLKDATEDPVTDVSGVGDKAFTTFHPDTGRYEMAAAVLGKFTVQVTGDDPDEVRSFVEQVITHY